MKRLIVAAAIVATTVALSGCSLWRDFRHKEEPPKSQGARAEAEARAKAQEDAKARMCGSLRDRKARDARGC